MNSQSITARISLCALAFALSACGGGSGGVNSTPPTGGGGGGGTTTPPPSGVNADLIAPLQSETFANAAAHAEATFSGTSTSGSEQIVTASIVYNSGNQTYQLTTPTGSISFGPGDIDNSQSSPQAQVYVRTSGSTTNSLTVTRPGTSGPLTYQYVGSAFWQQTNIGSTSGSGSLDSIVYGVPTPDVDVPRAGSAEYAIDLLGAITDRYGPIPLSGTGSASVDLGSGLILFLGEIENTQLSRDPSFVGQAQLSSTSGQFGGTFGFEWQQPLAGELSGMLFGPAATEIGAAWSASNGLGNVATGTIMGRQTGQFANDSFPLVNSQSFATSEATLDFDLNGSLGNNEETGDFTRINSGAGPLLIAYDEVTNTYGLSAAQDGLLWTVEHDPYNPSRYWKKSELTYVTAGEWIYDYRTGQNQFLSHRYSYHYFGMATPDGEIPRSGLGAYALTFDGTLIDNDYRNPLDISGTGLLRIDFADGAIDLSGGLHFVEDFSPLDRVSFSGAVNGTGALSADANSFSGTLGFGEVGDYQGIFGGSFFGPSLEEIAGTFAAAEQGGTGLAAGTFIGPSDPAAAGPGQTLAELSEPTALRGMRTEAGYEDDVEITFDPVAGTYGIPLRESSLGAPVIVGPSDIDPTRSDLTRTWYEKAGDDPISGYISNAQAGNPLIALSYTGFAAFNPHYLFSDRADDFAYYAFGLETPPSAVPQGGTATYSGIVIGEADDPAIGYEGSISGTNQLVADFDEGRLMMTLNIHADDGSATPIGEFAFQGNVSGNDFQIDARNFPDHTGVVYGIFFGPNAEEFGSVWWILSDGPSGRMTASGLAVGAQVP